MIYLRGIGILKSHLPILNTNTILQFELQTMISSSIANNMAPESLLTHLQLSHSELTKLKQQRELITKLHRSFNAKQKQICQLKLQLDKYQIQEEKYHQIKIELHQQKNIIKFRQRENAILRKQIDGLVDAVRESNEKVKEVEQARRRMVRERHDIERFNQEIEGTFREYQVQCRSREKGLVRDLESAYQKIQELQLENRSLQQIQRQSPIYKPQPERKRSSNQSRTKDNQSLLEENTKLRNQLKQKQIQLQRSKILNHDLSIEFDKSVNKICEFEKQLSFYRRENHELKKTMNLMLQQDRYEKMEKRFDKKKRAFGESREQLSEGEQEEDEEEEDEQEDEDEMSSPDMSEARI